MSATPFVEGSFFPGRAEAGVFSASGLQTAHSTSEGVQIAALGRFHLVDAELAVHAREAGAGAALARGWRVHGAGLLDRVAGEYALAIWCPADRAGLVAVDRFNTHSLYWGEHGGHFAFATRPASVCRALERAPELDPRAIHAYVHFHVIPAPLSVFRGVSRLDLGHAVLIEKGATRVVRHWQPEFVESEPFDFTRERGAFLSALRSGVAESIANVPREQLGCFLSGGTDSSTIAGLVTEAYGGPARTFSIGFDVDAYDERRYSRLAAKRFGTEHTEHLLTPREAANAIDALATAYEQPFGNSSALPTLVCARLAAESGVRRMLGGDGGDELYGGNERYAKQWLFSLYGQIPSALRDRMLEPLLFGPLAGVSLMPVRKARAYVEQARVPMPDRLGARYNLLTRFGAENVFTEALLGEAATFDPLELERDVWRRCDAQSQLNRMLAYDFKFTLGDNDLPKVVRMCHAAGCEVSFPMLANALTAHSLRLPPGQKLRRGKLRHFFRESLRGFLPDEIIDKPKHGFGMPFGDWMLSQPALAARADDALAGLAGRGLVRADFVGRLRDEIRAGHAGYFGVMTWVLMMLELWLRANLDQAAVNPHATSPDANNAVPVNLRAAEAR